MRRRKAEKKIYLKVTIKKFSKILQKDKTKPGFTGNPGEKSG